MSLFDEVADMMAKSWSVGQHVNRAQIMTALRAKYANEGELRAAMDQARAEITAQIEAIEAQGGKVVGIAKRVGECLGDAGECAFNGACMYNCGRKAPP